MGDGRWKMEALPLPYLHVLLWIIFFWFSGPPYDLRAGEWKQAVDPWKWSFPRDHGAHPDFRTEWWYFTGNLSDESARRFGYQLTFFREGVVFESKGSESPWSIRDLYLAHFTLTDVALHQFWSTDRISRAGPGLAGAATGSMDMTLFNWSARQEGHRIRLMAHHQEMDLSLSLDPQKPIVLHGENGLSRKGPKQGQASYYSSYTDLRTRGTLKIPGASLPYSVQGTSWFDHEFGSGQLAANQTGWDWFSLHLSDGHDLMIYFLRRTDGSIEPASSGTWVNPDGRSRYIALSEIRVDVLEFWKSPASGARYPSRWRVTIPSVGVEIVATPLVAAQELITRGSTGVTYWEGAIEGKGKSSGKTVTCEGYVELTGYAGSLGGLF